MGDTPTPPAEGCRPRALPLPEPSSALNSELLPPDPEATVADASLSNVDVDVDVDAGDDLVPICFEGDRAASRQCPRCGRWFCPRHGRGLCVRCRGPHGLAPSPLLFYGALLLVLLSGTLAVYHITAWRDDWAVRLSYNVARALEPAVATPTPAAEPRPQPSATPPPSLTPDPAGAPGPSAPDPTPTPEPSRAYTIQSGDTLIEIAVKFGTTSAVLAEANGMSTSAVLRVGQELAIPGP
ncbi:MAG: LysM peptidoglycan-binding domain-containing protein [Dehalococcoidia bacterium]|nr:LysM peptidoglycan-binding domain-containing protein [Dehalococcoidia bacterium]